MTTRRTNATLDRRVAAGKSVLTHEGGKDGGSLNALLMYPLANGLGVVAEGVKPEVLGGPSPSGSKPPLTPRCLPPEVQRGYRNAFLRRYLLNGPIARRKHLPQYGLFPLLRIFHRSPPSPSRIPFLESEPKRTTSILTEGALISAVHNRLLLHADTVLTSGKKCLAWEQVVVRSPYRLQRSGTNAGVRGLLFTWH